MFVDESYAIITVSVEVQYFVVVVAVTIPVQGKKKPTSLLKVTCRHLNRSNGVKNISESNRSIQKTRQKKLWKKRIHDLQRQHQRQQCKKWLKIEMFQYWMALILPKTRHKRWFHD